VTHKVQYRIEGDIYIFNEILELWIMQKVSARFPLSLPTQQPGTETIFMA